MKEELFVVYVNGIPDFGTGTQNAYTKSGTAQAQAKRRQNESQVWSHVNELKAKNKTFTVVRYVPEINISGVKVKEEVKEVKVDENALTDNIKIFLLAIEKYGPTFWTLFKDDKDIYNSINKMYTLTGF